MIIIIWNHCELVTCFSLVNALSHAITYGKLPMTSRKPELPRRPSEEEETAVAGGAK